MNKQKQEAREKLIDSLIASPQQRADKVWKILKPFIGTAEITNWDIISFCIAYLAAQAPMYDWMRLPLYELHRLHYTAHYYATEKLGLFGFDAEGNGIKEENVTNKNLISDVDIE